MTSFMCILAVKVGPMARAGSLRSFRVPDQGEPLGIFQFQLGWVGLGWVGGGSRRVAASHLREDPRGGALLTLDRGEPDFFLTFGGGPRGRARLGSPTICIWISQNKT
jgi:hypothetical protein